MLCIRAGARLLGISKPASIFGGSRGHTGPHKTVFSAVPKRPSQMLLLSITLKETLTAFSTRPHGLREIMYTDFKLGSPSLYKQRTEPFLAQRTFEKSNPFDDPDARHCLAFIDTEDRYLDSSYIWTEDATIVNRELSKHVRAAGKTTEWPVVLTTFNWSREMPFPTRHHYGRSVIVFKVPSTEDTFEFADVLRREGLKRKGLKTMHETPDGSFRRFMNEWWYHFLLRLPREQKYWSTSEC